MKIKLFTLENMVLNYCSRPSDVVIVYIAFYILHIDGWHISKRN